MASAQLPASSAPLLGAMIFVASSPAWF